MSGRLGRFTDGLRSGTGTLSALARAGLLKPVRPDRLVRMGKAARQWGPTAAAAVAASAARAPDDVRLDFRGDSDALIVKGLVAIVVALFGGKTPDQIRATDAEALFARLDLRSHLTTQRSNGLRALVDRIKSDAEAAAAASQS